MTVLEQALVAALFFSFGMVIVAVRWRTLFGDDRRIFSRMFWHYGSVFGDRLGAAIDRRMQNESIDRRILWCVCVAIVIVVALNFVNALELPETFAFVMAALALGVTIQALTTKRNGAFHVAILQPRDPVRIVPVWLFVLPAAVWIVGAYCVLRTHEIVPMLIALVASATSFYASYVIAAAPAMIGAQDPQMDAVVDMKVRAYRIRFVLLVGAMTPLVLAVALERSNDWLRLAAVGAMLLLAAWSKRQSDFSSSEVTAILASESRA